METIVLKPIGVIHTPFKTVADIPVQPTADIKSEGWIEVFDEYAEGIADLEGFSHIYVLFHLHKTEYYKLKVIPFLDTVERGVFATRSPARPNHIGLSVTRILSIAGSRINITGVDMLDGTPLIDIKPFVPDFEDTADIRKGWLEGKEKNIPGKRSDGRFT